MFFFFFFRLLYVCVVSESTLLRNGFLEILRRAYIVFRGCCIAYLCGCVRALHGPSLGPLQLEVPRAGPGLGFQVGPGLCRALVFMV
uniref:Putative secreted protein n=1 Tax=Ixodes ricinus TaxID=34613 RepID=A0A6B0U8F0_IXORI